MQVVLQRRRAGPAITGLDRLAEDLLDQRAIGDIRGDAIAGRQSTGIAVCLLRVRKLVKHTGAVVVKLVGAQRPGGSLGRLGEAANPASAVVRGQRGTLPELLQFVLAVPAATGMDCLAKGLFQLVAFGVVGEVVKGANSTLVAVLASGGVQPKHAVRVVVPFLGAVLCQY